MVSKDEIPRIGDEKKARKDLANKFDFFIASTDSMPLIGRYLGQVLGSRGKMPKPFPPQANLAAIVSQYQRTVRIKMRNTPTFHAKVGHVKMGDKEIADNIEAVLNFVKSKELDDKISNVAIKTTMGPSVKVST